MKTSSQQDTCSTAVAACGLEGKHGETLLEDCGHGVVWVQHVGSVFGLVGHTGVTEVHVMRHSPTYSFLYLFMHVDVFGYLNSEESMCSES